MAVSGYTWYFSWEVALIEWLQAHITGAALSVVSFLSVFGEEMFMILALGFLYWGWNKQLGKKVGLAVLTGCVWNPMIKCVVLRRRPYFDNEGIRILRVVQPEADIYDIAAQGFSFPSGHSTNAVALFGSLALRCRRRWLTVLAIVIPLLTGFSRVVTGAHYPTDVLAGWALGAVVVFLIPVLENKIPNRAAFYALLLATAVPGMFYCRSEDYFTAFGLLAGFMAGTFLEEKYVNFENTGNMLRIILRIAGGVALYIVLNKVLKLPFSEEFLDSGSMGALLVRTARYMIIAVVAFGVYPMLFRKDAKKVPETELL